SLFIFYYSVLCTFSSITFWTYLSVFHFSLHVLFPKYSSFFYIFCQYPVKDEQEKLIQDAKIRIIDKLANNELIKKALTVLEQEQEKESSLYP
ncbi:MAG: hypothetical protein J6P21_04230, partial [Clostridia bacterium]|nr:hypothetical protein [Clostridia bacterium]